MPRRGTHRGAVWRIRFIDRAPVVVVDVLRAVDVSEWPLAVARRACPRVRPYCGTALMRSRAQRCRRVRHAWTIFRAVIITLTERQVAPFLERLDPTPQASFRHVLASCVPQLARWRSRSDAILTILLHSTDADLRHLDRASSSDKVYCAHRTQRRGRAERDSNMIEC